MGYITNRDGTPSATKGSTRSPVAIVDDGTAPPMKPTPEGSAMRRRRAKP